MPELTAEESFDRLITRNSLVRVNELENGAIGHANPSQRFKWKPRHDFVVALDCSGYTREEICRISKFQYQTVAKILTDPRAAIARVKFKEGVLQRMETIHDKLDMMAHEALDELYEEMKECEDVKVRQRSALAILDRAGYTPVQKTLVANTTIRKEDADRLTSALAESKGVDVTFMVRNPRENDRSENPEAA